MKLKLTLARESKHSDMASAVGWVNGDEVVSSADDHGLLKWNLVTGETSSVGTLPDTVYPTDIHWYPRGLGGGSKKGGGGSDLFVLTATDVGEDGAVKIWSRSGMLRSTMSQNASPVYAGCWAPDNASILYVNQHNITIKPMQANAKPTNWIGHEGVILAADWNPSNGLIVSGSEDRKYKVWDSFGRTLYSSSAHQYPITAVCWSTDGEQFAVGSYNTLRLCDKAGWSHSLEKPRTGSIFNLRWSPDGTQLAGACGSGHVVFANVIEKRVEWEEFEVVQSRRKTMMVRNVLEASAEKLEVRDRVTNFALMNGYLIVTTSAQCYIYNSKNWNTPNVFDLKEGMVSSIIMAPKLFLLVDGGSVLVYGYEGRNVANIKSPGMRTEILNEKTLGLSSDTVVMKDRNDPKLIMVFDATNGKPLGDGKIVHTQEIIELCVDQVGSAGERRVAFVDKNNDLYIASVKTFGSGSKIVKLRTMVLGIKFNDKANMLVALTDGRLLLYCYPSVAYVDKELIPKTIVFKDFESATSKPPRLISYFGNVVTLRRSEGSLMSVAMSPFPMAIHAYVQKNKWDHALRLCRHLKDETMWGTLAGMAAYAKNLNTAEMAYSAIDEVVLGPNMSTAEKVALLSNIRRITDKDVKAAELALSNGNWREAEGILLQSGNIGRAILLNITMYRWNRALELAVKHKIHIDTVLGHRVKYLEDFDRKETEAAFEKYNGEVEVDWETIEENKKKELNKHTK